jgi:hypothetical protein
MNDRYRHSRDTRRPHQVVGDTIQLGDGVGDGVLRKVHRRHQRRRDIRQ